MSRSENFSQIVHIKCVKEGCINDAFYDTGRCMKHLEEKQCNICVIECMCSVTGCEKKCDKGNLYCVEHVTSAYEEIKKWQ